MNNTTEGSQDAEEHAIGTVILFLSFGVLSACLCKLILSQFLKNKFPVPFTVVVLILGFVIGTIVAHLKTMNNDFLLGEQALREINPHLIYYIFLPLLIFDSAFNSQFYVIKPQIVSSVLLAGPGVFVSIGLVAVVAVYIFPYNWSWLYALMFGSILSATDPVAVVALLHDSGASKSLAALIDLESLLNDGSAFVIFMIFRDIVIGRSNSVRKILVNILKFTVGGPAFGFACSIVAIIILDFVRSELEVEILSTFGLAYLVFYVADVELGVSAVLALVVMGLFMAKHKYCISSRVQNAIANTWHIIIELANIFIFLITGLILSHSLIGTRRTIKARDFALSLVLYLALHLARLLSVVLLYPLIRWSGVRLSWKEYVVLIWSGLRGSMSVILALIVNSHEQLGRETRDRFLFHICMMALLTLIINGVSCKFFVRILGLDHGTPASETILLQALEHMRKRTVGQLRTMKKDKQFADVDWHLLNEYLPDKLIEHVDSKRISLVYRRFTLNSDSPVYLSTSNAEGPGKETPSIFETDYIRMNLMLSQPKMLEKESNEQQRNSNFGDELTTRFLTALLADYEKQWFRGMLRRRTLYILIKSVERAKHQHSLQLHWKFILAHFRLSEWLLNLMRFDYVACINTQLNKLLFDHIFLTIELTLAFHSTRVRLERIQHEFPELLNIDERVSAEIIRELNLYYLTSTYMLLDLQHSYDVCWRMHMTKRCAQMLLKHESKTIAELHKTGLLGETEHAYIAGLIEKKLYRLEFYRVQVPKGEVKAIESAFELLRLFRALPKEQKERWQEILQPKHQWFQPDAVLLRKGERVSDAYLIARGILQCEIDTMPIYYRSGNIIGIDVLFAENYTIHGASAPTEEVERSYSVKALFPHSLTAYGTYSVYGGLLEAYRIDAALLNQFFEDEDLAPAIYHEIALHLLSQHYQSRLKVSRLQLKFILHKRAKFYWKQEEQSIQLAENHRLFILSGAVKHDNGTYDAIQLQILEGPAEVLINPATVAYAWTEDDEIFFDKDVDFSHDLRYPGYADTDVKLPERRHSDPELQ